MATQPQVTAGGPRQLVLVAALAGLLLLLVGLPVVRPLLGGTDEVQTAPPPATAGAVPTTTLAQLIGPSTSVTGSGEAAGSVKDPFKPLVSAGSAAAAAGSGVTADSGSATATTVATGSTVAGAGTGTASTPGGGSTTERQVALHREERGMAMITAVLISLVVLGLAVTATGIAISSNNQSARDRTRLQTIDAAEAGLNQTALEVEQSTPASLPCTLSGNLDANPPVHYQVTITYYATWPSGSPMSCPPTTAPAAATVASLGTSTGSSQAPGKMVTQIRLTPRYGGFDTALFSDTQLDLQNNLDIFANQGKDADVSPTGPWSATTRWCWRAASSPGRGHHEQLLLGGRGRVRQERITMSNNTRIGHDAKSSQGSISLADNAQIDNNATAYSTITPSGSARVNGTRTQNYTTLADPPVKTLPTINYNATSWSTTGYVIATYASCDAARSRLLGGCPTTAGTTSSG